MLEEPQKPNVYIQPILDINDPFLKEPTTKFNFDAPPMPSDQLFNELKHTMIANKGLGLSANQIGYPWSVFVMGDHHNPDQIAGVFNPTVVHIEDQEWTIEEGCLSAPGLWVKIKRPKVVKVRFTNPSGKTDTIRLDGMSARVFLHEYDHLQGITFKQRANRYHLEMAQKQKKKLDKLRKKRAL